MSRHSGGGGGAGGGEKIYQKSVTYKLNGPLDHIQRLKGVKAGVMM